MKIGVVQFDARLGHVEQNMQTADKLLSTCDATLKLLVLPEMAFSGYNFSDREHIKPYLEPTAAGPTTVWATKVARERGCTVIVGYPETTSDKQADGTVVSKNYNSTVTVGPEGQILANYRKSFLYYTDETWAEEGFRSTSTQTPFFASTIPTLNGSTPVGHGICMDINPYRFTAPWSDYEFATHMLRNQCKLVILSMAWLTRLLPEECEIDPERPDMETVAYWLERFWPFVETSPSEPIVVVMANRCGSEGTSLGTHAMEDGKVVEMGNRVTYAGSSCVMMFQGGNVKLWEQSVGPKKGDVGLLGKGVEDMLVVDTSGQAGFLLQQKQGTN